MLPAPKAADRLKYLPTYYRRAPSTVNIAFVLDITGQQLYYTGRAELKTAGCGIFAASSFGNGSTKSR
jgi:hypothetical protein